jgi:multidrug efflux system outer membrane protein
MKRLVSLLAMTALAGCSLAPGYVRPAAPVPASWPAGDAYLRQSEQSLPAVTYAEVFTDPRLHRLIAQALDNNRDLRIAAANIAAARAQVRVVRSAQFPELGVDGAASYRAGGSGTASGESYVLQGGVSSFELDLFGRLRNATAAERDRALSTEAAARAVRLGLIADLATAWATYAADRDLLAIARDTAGNAEGAVRLTRLRLEGGIAPRTDLRQAEQLLATAQGDVAAQTAALAQDANLIQLLVGAPIDDGLLPGGLQEVMDTVAVLPAGTSSEVLLRRPDVIEAEHLLRAANADIGVARAELFPRISLTGLLGVASDALGSLFTGDAFSATVGGELTAPIFDFGGRQANVRVTQAQRDAAVAVYERTIQAAFREVADALAVQGTIGERVRAAHANTEAAADTARLTEARYRGGVDSFLGNLDAQRSLYAARAQETVTMLTALENRATLYRVLAADPTAATP